MRYTNNVLPIRNYPEYDDNGTRVLYLIPELSITKDQYDCIVKNIGTDGPGWQVLKVKGSYVLHSDADPATTKSKIKSDLAARGITLPADPTKPTE